MAESKDMCILYFDRDYKLSSRNSLKILPAMEKVPFLQTLSTLDINDLFNFCQYEVWKIVMCVFLNTSDIKHLLICLLAYFISSFLQLLFPFFFSYCIFVFLFLLVCDQNKLTFKRQCPYRSFFFHTDLFIILLSRPVDNWKMIKDKTKNHHPTTILLGHQPSLLAGSHSQFYQMAKYRCILYYSAIPWV